MITILLTILKVLGILLLFLVAAAIVLLLLAMFVPVRYRVNLRRKEEDNAQVRAELKVTWLMHLVNVAFSYPEAAFFRVRLLGFTVFRSDQIKTSGKKDKATPKAAGEPESEKEDGTEDGIRTGGAEAAIGSGQEENQAQKQQETSKEQEPEPGPETGGKKESVFAKINRLLLRLKEFFQKLLSLFQNIRYTITKICDKIKDIVNNIQYYLKILKSDTFSRAWRVCSGQVLSLLKSVLPGKVTGSLVVGTGDPAGTGQVLAVYGMLYPLLGNHISVTPDFERKIVEGELFIKGKITVFKGLKTAWKIYFNRDVRRLIQLFKREAA